MKKIILFTILLFIVFTKVPANGIDDIISKYRNYENADVQLSEIHNIPESAKNDLQKLITEGQIDSMEIIVIDNFSSDEINKFRADFNSIEVSSQIEILMDINTSPNDDDISIKLISEKENDLISRLIMAVSLKENEKDQGGVIITFYGSIKKLNPEAIIIDKGSVSIE